MILRLSGLVRVLVVLSAPVLAQQALVPFDVPQVQLGGYATPFQRLFDFDQDGDVDAVGARLALSSSGTPVYLQAQVYVNDGSGAFQPGWTDTWNSPAAANPEGAPLAVGDLDGDGYDDFALVLGSELWRIYSNEPAPGFTRVLEPCGVVVRSLSIADFDGDGSEDVALLLGSLVEVRMAAGPVLQASSAMPLDYHDHLIAVDTDGDPLPDLVLASGWMMQPFAILGSSLIAANPLPFVAYGPMVDGADIEGDGDMDVVAFHMAAGTIPPRVEVFRRSGPLQWSAEPPYQGGPAEYLADIDADGDPDGVCCGGGGGGATYPALTFPSTFELALNQGGVFVDAIQLPGIGSKSLAGARDVDGDGDTDLVAGRCVYFNRGAWSGVASSGLVGIETPEETADLDTDGDLDAWVQTTGFPGIESQAWRSRGDGTFGLQPMVMEAAPAGTTLEGPRIQGDFDGDGDADVILGVRQGASFLYEGLWRNSGGGSFHFTGPCAPAGVRFYVDSWISNQAYLVGDFEADGDLDLVMRDTPASWSAPYGKAIVYRNTGNAFFQPGPSYTSEQAMAITDFDQDGYNDLIVAAPVSPGGVRLLRGQPAGMASMFDGGTPISGWWTMGKSQPVDVRDFNQDGYPDLALATNKARIYVNGIPLGLGLATVETVPSEDPLDGYWGDPRVIGLDVNGDGRTDLISGPFESNRSWRVYLQTSSAGRLLGPGAYEPGVGVVLSPWLSDDADGDGDLDVWGEFLASNIAIFGAGKGSRLQYGAGAPGTAGVVPTLGASGPFRVGETPQLRLRGAHGPLAYLAVSQAAAALPDFLFAGLTLLVDPLTTGAFLLPMPVSGSAAGPGQGKSTVPVFVEPAWNGLSFYHQAFVIDLGAPNGLVSTTNGLRLTYGL